MSEILIMDNDATVRGQMAELLVENGYDVIVSKNAASGLGGVIKRLIQIVVLGGEVDGIAAAELIPILKKCNPRISIILISGEIPLAVMQKVRREGIFYHVLKPIMDEDKEEIRKVMDCAFLKTMSDRGVDAFNNSILQ